MKSFYILGLAMLLTACTQAQVPHAEDQIGGAVLAAPAQARAEVTVLGYISPGRMSMLKKGTNELICLADNPDKEGFDVVCYHKDLDPYMARGRELRKEGIGGSENLATRQAEIEAGTLSWPTQASMLYVLSGDEGAYDSATGTAETARLRYVIYVPYVTGESTGFSVTPTVPGAPWLMGSGTYRAHIMIVPPAADQ
ncbi:MAG: hypothetical protein BMS9Abin05_2203 [Rhodothermia bacterium]|nr:MAG: hypothetical protein BMS9Abin05_2203 [Rhodothermia bacterium]